MPIPQFFLLWDGHLARPKSAHPTIFFVVGWASCPSQICPSHNFFLLWDGHLARPKSAMFICPTPYAKPITLKSRIGLFEKLCFFGSCFASQNLIAVGKSPKTLDYF